MSAQSPEAGGEERAARAGGEAARSSQAVGRPAGLDLGQRLALPIAWIAVIVVFGALKPSAFLTSANFSTIFGSQAVLVVVALALVIPLTAGDYDLSIAATLTLSAMMIAVLNVYRHWEIGFAIAAAMGAGLAIGLLNGFLIVVAGVDSIIVTIGTGTFVQGVVLWISGSDTIGGVSQDLVDAVILTKFLGISVEFYYGLGLCVILWYLLEYTAVGRRLLFVGRGREVSRLSGLRVGRLRWGALIASSLLGAAAGVIYVGNGGGTDPSSGLSFLLPGFAAAFLGETSIVPGRFNAWGTIIAAYFLTTGITGLQLIGVAGFVQPLFYGGALVVAVVLAETARRRRGRTRSRARPAA